MPWGSKNSWVNVLFKLLRMLIRLAIWCWDLQREAGVLFETHSSVLKIQESWSPTLKKSVRSYWVSESLSQQLWNSKGIILSGFRGNRHQHSWTVQCKHRNWSMNVIHIGIFQYWVSYQVLITFYWWTGVKSEKFIRKIELLLHS